MRHPLVASLSENHVKVTLSRQIEKYLAGHRAFRVCCTPLTLTSSAMLCSQAPDAPEPGARDLHPPSHIFASVRHCTTDSLMLLR